MRKVPLGGLRGKGLFALIDDVDLQLVAQSNWYLDSQGYASSARHVPGKVKGEGGRTENVRLHRLIMGLPEAQVDHRDRDRLNNQRSNLRLATHAQNCQNTVKKIVSKTGYRGVKQESENVFVARLSLTTIGYYDTAEKAAMARDLAAIVAQGDFAILNFPRGQLPLKVDPLPSRNTGERTSSTAGVSYAAKQKRRDKWRAVYKKKHIGWFATEALAVLAIKEAKNESCSD